MSYQRKVGNQFFPELPVKLWHSNSLDMKRNSAKSTQLNIPNYPGIKKNYSNNRCNLTVLTYSP
jgi:hypothetical protein